MFTDDDVERLETILRLQRDEFLPLRVIREELEMPGAERARRRSHGIRDREEEIDQADLCERGGVTPEFVRELEEYGLLTPRLEGGDRLYRESEADIATTCARIPCCWRCRGAGSPTSSNRRRANSPSRR